MNELPEDNDFTGEVQDQCPICKLWGWRDAFVGFTLVDDPNGEEIEICNECDDEHDFTSHCPPEDSTLPFEQWARLKALVAEGEAKSKVEPRPFVLRLTERELDNLRDAVEVARKEADRFTDKSHRDSLASILLKLPTA